MGKIKKEPVEQDEKGDVIKTSQGQRSYDRKIKRCSVIAKPMATKKLCEKIFELIKTAYGHKQFLRNGLKIVQKQLREGERGLVFFAGDVSPIEIMCHIPAICEEKNIPYCYVPSRIDIGAAMGISRGCVMVMVRKHKDYIALYKEVKKGMKLLPFPMEGRFG